MQQDEILKVRLATNIDCYLSEFVNLVRINHVTRYSLLVVPKTIPFWYSIILFLTNSVWLWSPGGRDSLAFGTGVLMCLFGV